jgi:UDP-N-acetylglucosamine:LPS N-acetylglucosamine transferase
MAELGTTVVCICGRNEEAREELERRFQEEPQVRVEGFTEQIGDLFAAADVLIHSTAGLTVLEAMMRGCNVISYGWGHGHLKANNEAYARFGLAEVAADRDELRGALKRSLADPAEPDRSFEALPTAASEVLRLIRERAPA